MSEDISTDKRKMGDDESSAGHDIAGEQPLGSETNKRQKMISEKGKEERKETEEMKIDEAVEVEADSSPTGAVGGTEAAIQKAADASSSIQAEMEDESTCKKEEYTTKGRREDPTPNPYEKLCWTIIKNDGRPESLVKLVALKSLFAKQLPKMPKAYIARLVFDRRHISLVILSDDPKVKDTDKEVIGSICYRPFPEMRFAEIAFCAVNSDHQVKVNFPFNHYAGSVKGGAVFNTWSVVAICHRDMVPS